MLDSGYASDASIKEDLNECFIEDVTDNKYDAGPEVTEAMIWRHIVFHIIRSPDPGRPNILLAKITLLHIKEKTRNQECMYLHQNLF